MAHCSGDAEGTWLVLTILQATAGQLGGSNSQQQQQQSAAGEKIPQLHLLAKRGTGSDRPAAAAAATAAQDAQGGDDWLFLASTNQLPQHGDAEALYQLLQLHVPEALRGGEDDNGNNDNGAERHGSSSLAARQLCFAWGMPHLVLSSQRASSSSGGGEQQRGWYLDLLQPLPVAVGPAATSGGGQGSGDLGSLLPPGVLVMDAYLEARAARKGM